jgi:cytochrome P450
MYLVRNDGDEHRRLRGTANRVFTPHRISAMRESIERYTNDFLDEVNADDVIDFLPTLAYRLPLMAIADMLDLPIDYREQIHEWSNQLGRNRGGDNTEALIIAAQAVRDFRHYIEEVLIPLRTAGHGSDLISALLDAEESDRLRPEELTAMIVVLLFAGHETTTNLLSVGVLELMRHRDQWELLCDNPAMSGQATEELLRFVSPVQWINRVAVMDFEVDGYAVKKGQTVFPILAAANRDPEVFEDPERLDLSRADASKHLALGFGPHSCLGNTLVRLEGSVVFEALARRFPSMELVEPNPGWRGNAMLRAMTELPLLLAPA